MPDFAHGVHQNLDAQVYHFWSAAPSHIFTGVSSSSKRISNSFCVCTALCASVLSCSFPLSAFLNFTSIIGTHLKTGSISSHTFATQFLPQPIPQLIPALRLPSLQHRRHFSSFDAALCSSALSSLNSKGLIGWKECSAFDGVPHRQNKSMTAALCLTRTGSRLLSLNRMACSL